ncbi:hypothetical protein EV401DRAFT_1943105 [Pisolithus croceorrhizus]|nr:hypothetical protein EV401DRAFT_1943105 [Pisolithus croceorrhizus]
MIVLYTTSILLLTADVRTSPRPLTGEYMTCKPCKLASMNGRWTSGLSNDEKIESDHSMIPRVNFSLECEKCGLWYGAQLANVEGRRS